MIPMLVIEEQIAADDFLLAMNVDYEDLYDTREFFHHVP
jgi:hypothetical protein